MSNSLDPDQDQHSVGPDLGGNCLQLYSGVTLVNVYVYLVVFTHIAGTS